MLILPRRKILHAGLIGVGTLLLPKPAHASVAFQNAGVSTAFGSAATASLSFNATGANFLVAFLHIEFTGSTPTSVTATYNSVSMTSAGAAATTGHSFCQAFFLANPSTGTNTIQFNWTNNSSNGFVSCESFSGASGSISGYQTNTVTGTASATTVTTGQPGDICVSGATNQHPATYTFSGTIEENTSSSSPSNVGIGNGWTAGAASVTSTWTLAGGASDTQVSLAFDVIAGPSSHAKLPLLGVGN